jgi:hypothetical protein
LSFVEVVVIAPDNDHARFDAGRTYPAQLTDVFEAKTGGAWAIMARSKWTRRFNQRMAEDRQQFADQSRVATKCKLKYHIFFQKRAATIGYLREAPEFAPYYETVP